MRNRWLIPVIILVAFIGFAVVANYNDWGPDKSHNEVQTIVHSDGSTETVTIERDWDRGGPGFFFFPFGILLFILFWVFVARLFFGGFRGGPPPWARDDERQRFEQWHREEHEKMAQ